MHKSALQIASGVWLDPRKAAYLEEHRTLCIADPHIGYGWAARASGTMLPLAEDSTPARIEELCASYKPDQLAILGDIVHRAVPAAHVRNELERVLERVGRCSSVRWIIGNHDRGLERLLDAEPVRELRIGRFLLVHGDAAVRNAELSFVVMGHEHPSISLGDGVRGAKFPCFVSGRGILVLPAFSNWAAGSDIRSGVFMSPFAKEARFSTVVAIMGHRLLEIPVG